ncbi:hypothetical protein EC988_003373 [Linderina pennispora]|nr:hypothetical protein EC988_003373 [Linderina pennispora]
MSQQQTKQRRQKGRFSPEDEARLIARLDGTYNDELLALARHFGGQLQATRAHVKDIDVHGLTVEWETEGKREEMQFAFREVTGPASAMEEINELATEALQALGVTEPSQLARDRAQLQSQHLVDFSFRLPGVPLMAAVLLGMGLQGYLGLVAEVHPMVSFFRVVLPQMWSYYIFVVACGLHVFEGLACCALCQLIKLFQPKQMSTREQLKWTVGVTLFGLGCFHDFLSRLRRQFALADAIGPRPPNPAFSKKSQ